MKPGGHCHLVGMGFVKVICDLCNAPCTVSDTSRSSAKSNCKWQQQAVAVKTPGVAMSAADVAATLFFSLFAQMLPL